MPLLSTFGAASARAFGLFNNLIEKFITLYSLRFNSDSTDYLNKTFSTTPTTWTMSVWVKRANIGSLQSIAGARNVSISSWGLRFIATSALEYIKQGSIAISTTALFRDPSAWYHIVLSSAPSGTINLYVNNVLVDSASASTNGYLFIGSDSYVNAIGRRGDSGDSQYNGYMSQFYFIDGQQLTPSSFAETDPSVPSSGIWVPKTYTGSYGTEGFFLEFENSASLGTDSSGNGNNWTLNNLTSIDQSTDAPTNNFATWNPLYPGGNQTFTEGNLQIATGTTGGSIGTIAVNTGKWYWEIKVISATALARIAGIFQLLGTNTNLFSQGTVYYKLNGNIDINNVDSAYGASLTTNDIVGVAIDVDARSVIFYKNGVSQGAIDLSSVYNVGDDITASMVQSSSTNQTVAANFGNPPFAITSGNSDANGFGNFEYAVPSGYYALCTKNLSEYA